MYKLGSMKFARFIVIFSICVLVFSAWAERPVVVCGITINSDNEFKAMARALGSMAEARELVQYKMVDGLVNFDSDQWLSETCKQSLACDVVVLSGHFGGIFGHESLPIMLPLDTLERGSCSNKCQGVFQTAKEVYLLGCKSLSRNDGTVHDLSMLERPSLDSRGVHSGALIKQSNFERMRRIFPNAARIYGYADAGPLGPQVEQAFFQSISRQKDHFSELKVRSARELDDISPFKLPILAQTRGSDLDRDLALERQRTCGANFSSSVSDRVINSFELLLQSNGIKFLPQTLTLLNRQRLSSADIQRLTGENFVGVARRSEGWTQDDRPLAVQLLALELLRKMGRIEEAKFFSEVQARIRKASMENENSESLADAVCYASEWMPTLRAHIKVGTISHEHTWFTMRVVDCVRPTDKGWISLLNDWALNANEDYLRNLAQRTLRRLKTEPLR